MWIAFIFWWQFHIIIINILEGLRNLMDIIIIIAAIFVLVLSQILLTLAKRKPKQWQEENRDLIKRYSKAQFVLIILFTVYLIVNIIMRLT